MMFSKLLLHKYVMFYSSRGSILHSISPYEMFLHLLQTRHNVLKISLTVKALKISTNSSSGKAVQKHKLKKLTYQCYYQSNVLINLKKICIPTCIFFSKKTPIIVCPLSSFLHADFLCMIHRQINPDLELGIMRSRNLLITATARWDWPLENELYKSIPSIIAFMHLPS